MPQNDGKARPKSLMTAMMGVVVFLLLCGGASILLGVLYGLVP